VMASRVQCDVDNASDRTALQGVPELAWLPVCVTHKTQCYDDVC